MKNAIIVIIILAVYGGSLVFKSHEIERRKSVYIPTTYDLHKKNGIPVTIEEVKRGTFQKFITVTGEISGLEFKSSVAPFIKHQVRNGSRARLELKEGEKVIWGNVSAISASPGLLTGLHEMTIHFKQKVSAAQQFVTVDIPVKEIPGAVLVPREAVSNRGQKPFVYILEDKNITKKYIELAGSNPDVYWIKSGIVPNQKVITSDTRYFSGGEFVKVVNEARKEL